jgi:DNA-binding FrmR family transcriptional regulator
LAERVNSSSGRAPGIPKVKPMKIESIEAKEQLIQRLRRIEGQMRGVQNMVEEDRDCKEILQQLSAVHSALQSASRLFLQEYATNCLLEADETKDSASKRREIIQDMLTLLNKAP